MSPGGVPRRLSLSRVVDSLRKELNLLTMISYSILIILTA